MIWDPPVLRQTTEVDPQAGGSEQVCGACSSLHQSGGRPPPAHPRHRHIRFADWEGVRHVLVSQCKVVPTRAAPFRLKLVLICLRQDRILDIILIYIICDLIINSHLFPIAKSKCKNNITTINRLSCLLSIRFDWTTLWDSSVVHVLYNNAVGHVFQGWVILNKNKIQIIFFENSIFDYDFFGL